MKSFGRDHICAIQRARAHLWMRVFRRLESRRSDGVSDGVSDGGAAFQPPKKLPHRAATPSKKPSCAPTYLAAIFWIIGLHQPLHAALVEGFVPVESGQLYYEATVSGTETVVLIHAHSVDRRMWDDQFAELAKRFRVIRYDLRGYGKSSMPDEESTFTHAEDLRRLLLALHIPRAHLVGSSLGAFVAGDFMALHPRQTLSISVASGGVHHVRFPLSAADHAKRLKEISQVRQRGIDVFKREWIDAMKQASGPRWEEIRPPSTRMTEDWTAWQPLHVEPASLLGENLLEHLAARPVDVPVQIVISENDSTGSKRSSERLARAIPAAKITRVSDAGHWSGMEQPEAFTQAIVSFIASLSTETPTPP